MEKLVSNIDKSLQDEFNKDIEVIRPALIKILNYNDINFFLDTNPQTKTFYFAPKERIIGVPLTWYQGVCKKTENKNPKYHEKIFRFGLWHEVSHFRDLLKEKENFAGLESMLNILEKISKEVIIVSENEYIPIGESIHALYNCIDDIVVNTEVRNNLKNDFDDEFLEYLYKNIMFVDYLAKEGGAYEKDPIEGIRYVGEGNGTMTINNDQSVDYTKYESYKALPYFFLRSKMVDQKIILSDDVNCLIRNKNDKPIVWRESLKNLKSLMQEKFKKVENENKDPEHIKKIKIGYNKFVFELEQIIESNNTSNGPIQKLLFKIKKDIPSIQKSIQLFSLIEIIDFFTRTRGVDESHKLIVPPHLRYEILELLFQPFIKGLVRIDILEKKPPKNDGEGDNANNYGHGDSDIKDIKKAIEDLKEEKKKEDAKKKLEAEANKNKKAQYDILKGLTDEQKKLYKKIKENFVKEIGELTDFFVKQLEVIIPDIINIEEYSKKGNLNYDRFIKEISKDPKGIDINKKYIYDKIDEKKEITSKIKKINVILPIDISGSMSGYKGEKGLLNGIITVISIAWKQAEFRIKDIIKDPNYSIPIDYVIYDDQVKSISNDIKENQNMDSSNFDKRLAQVNDDIVIKSGGTNDRVAWEMIQNYLEENFFTNNEFIEEIKNNERKTIILQVADSDVSEDGVNPLIDMIEKKYGKDVLSSFLIKRIQLGESKSVEINENEYMSNNEKYWDPEWLKQADGKPVLDKNGKKILNVKEIGIKTKSEIIDAIKKIFSGVFADTIKNK